MSSPSLADRLVTACAEGDLPSAVAAVADGASVNEQGKAPRWSIALLPLVAAAANECHDAVVWLLSHGADANGDKVMYHGAYYSTAGMLQLLIDAGGDVNRPSGGQPPLFTAVLGFNSEGNVRVLLAQPSLDLAATTSRPHQYARDCGKHAVADAITQEVSEQG